MPPLRRRLPQRFARIRKICGRRPSTGSPPRGITHDRSTSHDYSFSHGQSSRTDFAQRQDCKPRPRRKIPLITSQHAGSSARAAGRTNFHRAPPTVRYRLRSCRRRRTAFGQRGDVGVLVGEVLAVARRPAPSATPWIACSSGDSSLAVGRATASLWTVTSGAPPATASIAPGMWPSSARRHRASPAGRQRRPVRRGARRLGLGSRRPSAAASARGLPSPPRPRSVRRLRRGRRRLGARRRPASWRPARRPRSSPPRAHRRPRVWASLLVHPQLFHQRPGADFFDVAHVDQAQGDELVDHARRVMPSMPLSVSSSRLTPSWNSAGVRMSMSQPVSRAARRTFCPRLPMARLSWSSFDHHRRPAQLEAQGDFRDFRRLQGVADQDLRRLVPADDVDLLAAEFVDDVLDPAAAHADARADRVHLGVDRRDGDLRAVPRLAGQGLESRSSARRPPAPRARTAAGSIPGGCGSG